MLNGTDAEVRSTYFLSLDKTFCSIFLIFNFPFFFTGRGEILMAALGHEVKITSTQITFLTAAPLGKAASLHHSWSLRCPQRKQSMLLDLQPFPGRSPKVSVRGDSGFVHGSNTRCEVTVY